MNNTRKFLFVFISMLSISFCALAQDNQSGFSNLITSPDVVDNEAGKITIKDTSRDKWLNWGPMQIPSEKGAFSQRISGLKITITEQKGLDNGIIETFYSASGTLVNGSEDDKTHVQTYWTIRFTNSAGGVIDTYTFSLPHDHCSYSGEEPFTTPLFKSAFNLFDVIVDATAQGTKPAGYEGGC